LQCVEQTNDAARRSVDWSQRTQIYASPTP
jgi:hypothetical protein